MTDQEPQLLAPPPGYAYSQQPKETLEEVTIQFDLFSAWRTVLSKRGRAGPASSGILLLGDGGADTIEEGKEERQIDGAGDFGPMI